MNSNATTTASFQPTFSCPIERFALQLV